MHTSLFPFFFLYVCFCGGLSGGNWKGEEWKREGSGKEGKECGVLILFDKLERDGGIDCVLTVDVVVDE